MQKQISLRQSKKVHFSYRKISSKNNARANRGEITVRVYLENLRQKCFRGMVGNLSFKTIKQASTYSPVQQISSSQMSN